MIKKTIFRKIITITIIIFSPLFLTADEIPEIEILNEFKSKSIGNEIQIFQDSEGTLSIHDLLSNDFLGEFKNVSKEYSHFGFTGSTIWVKFKLKKNIDVKSRSPLVIVNEFPMIDHTHFYQIDNNNVPEKIVETGVMHPVHSRDHIYYKIVFLANMPPGESRTFYISFKSDFILSLNLRILSMTEFMKDGSVKITFIGIFIGIFLFLAGYHLFLFFINWEYISLFFSLTILSMLLFALSYTGFAGLYLWPNIFWIKKYAIYLFAGLIQIFLLSFINSLYKIKIKNTSFYKLSRLTIFSLIVFTSLSIATGSDLALLITKLLIFITFFSLPFIILILKRESEQKTLFFIIGTFIFIASIILFILSKFSILNLEMLAEYALRLGPGIFIVLTSLSLAERTKALKIAKKKFEHDLKDSRQRFRSLEESIYDIIWETDQKGVFTYISSNIKTIIGFEPSQLIGKKFIETFVSEPEEKVPDQFSDKRTIKKPVVGLINSIRGPYDKQISFETNALPFYDDKENFLGYRGINREITERLRTEKVQEIIFNISNSVNTSVNMDEFYEIIHSELNKVVDATNFFVGIYEKETDSIILPYLKDEKDKYEKTPAEGTISAIVIKENRSLLLKPEDIVKLETEGKIGIVGSPSKIWLGVPLEIDSRVIGLLVLQSYEDENAYSEADLKLMEFISGQIAVSITKKQVEERIHILAQSVEQSPALVLITDLNANIEYVNKKFEEITGYSMDEVLGLNPSMLKSGKIPKSTYVELWDYLNQGKEWRGEFHNRKKNGDFYWELAFITPIKNELGKISHYLAIKEDITERKELELQLMQSQKMESVGTLAGGISHDFNNILTVINGYSDLALMRLKETDPLYEEISTIKKAGKRGEKLTRQIMAFSRKQIFHPLVVNINHIIEGLENMLTSLIEEDFSITFDLYPDIPLIKADPSQIEQILINLLVNARDAINLRTQKADEKKIIVKTGIQFVDERFKRKHMITTDGAHVYISVEDNGVGMTEDVRQNIFEPFFTTKVRGKGTGMGLATVYGIVKQNNSSILVLSSPGNGTTFQILWPVTTEKLSDHDSKEIVDADLYGDEVILFVEDDKHVKEFAVTALKDFGYKVHSSINGKHALNYVKQKKLKFDILITDLVMPDMNGKELSEKILEIYPDLDILFTSGYTENQLVKSGELEDNINFLPKPYTAKSLLTFVRKILKSKT